MRSFQAVDIALMPAYVLVVVFGTLGNCIVVTAVRKKRVMRTTTNYLLANLAVADLNTLLWCLPGAAMKFVHNPGGAVGRQLCRFVSMHHVAGVSLFASGLLLTLLSVERYNALLHPMNVNLRLTKATAKYPIAACWLVATAFTLPLLVQQTYNDQRQVCYLDWPAYASALAYWAVLGLVITMCFLVVCFCYISIIKELYCTRGASDNSATLSHDTLAKRKIMKLSLTVTLVFLVSFLPFAIVSAIFVPTDSVAYAVSYFLVFCGTSLNPICYAFQSSNYRSAFRKSLGWSRPDPTTLGRSLHVLWGRQVDGRLRITNCCAGDVTWRKDPTKIES